MKKIVLLTILIFAASAPAQTKGSKAASLKVEGIGLGAGYETVVNKLGKPIRVINESAEPCVGGKSRKIQYSGLTFSFTDDPAKPEKFYVDRFEVTRSHWTVSGIKVGAAALLLRNDLADRGQLTRPRTAK